MDFRRLLLIAGLVCLGMAGFGLLLAGCESKPTAPQFDNAFDPEAPGGGDPLQPSAQAADTTVTVSWHQPQSHNIAKYDILHALSPTAAFVPVGEVEHTATAMNSFTHKGIEPTRTHYYKVRAVDGDGTTAMISDQVPASAATTPLVAAGDALRRVASRQIDLLVTVSMGDTLRIASSDDFSDEIRVPVAAWNQPQAVAWDLGPAAANGETKDVYVRAFDDVSQSAVAHKTLTVNFAPSFAAAGDPATVASRALDLSIVADGVAAMRFALSEADLATQPWLPGADALSGFLLADSANPQVVYGEFAGDFGFNATATWTAVPDLLTDVSFDLLAGDDNLTDELIVPVYSDARATEMRFSESLDFSTGSWTAFADTSVFLLSPGAGRKLVYGQFRNDWAESAVVTDWVDYVSQSLVVEFLAPREGAILHGGSGLQVRGYALQPSGGTGIDAVGFDPGDGNGFRLADGTTNWTYLWQIPTYDDDTELTVRSRAWAGSEMATTTLNVTVTQVNVAVTYPAPDDTVTAGSAVTVTGTAKPALDGAPLDQVSVSAAGASLTVAGTATWTAGWTPPSVTADSLVSVIATASAGAEAVADTVAVIIRPAAGD